ncbi:hypothetical protein [Nostoc sp.]|uniref:hypothetical protein n=1 Tax=Nostoc sp. TaxID=1180 RepID=UPI002FFB0047
MQLGIRITNNTPTVVRFSFFVTIIPQLVKANNQVCLQRYFSRTITKRPLLSDFPLILPGENITFFPYTLFFWCKRNQFTLKIDAGDGGYCIFKALKVGVYQIRLTYNNKEAIAEIYDR